MADFHKQTTQVGKVALKPVKAEDVVLPAFVGPYKIESLLGQGGMSFVYLALDPITKDPVTIKVLRPQFLQNAEVNERFLKEAEIISLSDHPNIVKIISQGQWEGGVFIAMEFIQGLSLRHFILASTLSLQRACQIMLQVSHALLHLHAHEVIHRDLKPENVLITDKGGVKVIDFGIALFRNEEVAGSSTVMGTPVYMSPEQQKSPASVTYNTDIYSLGVILYELILGKLSHGKIHINLMPRGIQKLLIKALQPDPKERYQDIVDFIADLSAYLESPSFKTDRASSGEYVNEISDHLDQARKALLPIQKPNWPRIELGLLTANTFGLSGIYYDFFSLPEQRMALVIGEPATKGIQGLVQTGILKGMIRAIAQIQPDPAQLIRTINAQLLSDEMDQIFTLNVLTLDPIRNELHFVSCGYGQLWHAEAGSTPQSLRTDNLALGLSADQDFIQIQRKWQIGDTILLNSFGAASSSEALLKDALIQSANLPPQRAVESIARKIQPSSQKSALTRSLLLISLLRKS